MLVYRDRVIAAVVVVLALAALAPRFDRAAIAQDDPRANEEVVRRFYAEVMRSDGDLAAIDTLLAADFLPQDPDDVAGPSAYQQRRVDQRAALADLGFVSWAYEIEDVMATGERVAVRATFRGRLAGQDAPREANQLAWFTVEDGQITRLWSEQDNTALFGR